MSNLTSNDARTLSSHNPATGEKLRPLQRTQAEELPEIFRLARNAQSVWADVPIKIRAKKLLALREAVLNDADGIVDLIHLENGKPKTEALTAEVLPILDMLTYFAKIAPQVLATKRIPMRLVLYRESELEYWPLGVVAVISPWNYPFLLPFAEIIMALVAGNAVVFKPSELTPLVGLKIQELCEKAGLSPHLISTLVGDGTLGAAIIQQKPNKIFFTGSVPTGKKIMAAAAEHLIPVNLELGGKDAMIVLPDADLDYATSAALWGAFSNAGQACASTERILVHESIADAFLSRLKDKVSQLRPSTDQGPITMEKQKDVYTRQLAEARQHGLRFLTGGEFSSDHTHLAPTIVAGEEIERLAIYREETFGPVVAVSSYRTTDEAVQKANDSPYGLLASIIGKSRKLTRQVAHRLEVGTVTINEVLYTAGLGETPWGGVKESGIGRSHAEVGLYEFVNIRHIHQPRARFLVFKSPWWFPYTKPQYALFRTFIELYRNRWVDKGKALPSLAKHAFEYLRNDRRI